MGTANDAQPEEARLRSEREAGATADAADGAGSDLPEAAVVATGPGHRISPYRLRGLAIERPHQVWGSDIT